MTSRPGLTPHAYIPIVSDASHFETEADKENRKTECCCHHRQPAWHASEWQHWKRTCGFLFQVQLEMGPQLRRWSDDWLYIIFWGDIALNLNPPKPPDSLLVHDNPIRSLYSQPQQRQMSYISRSGDIYHANSRWWRRQYLKDRLFFCWQFESFGRCTGRTRGAKCLRWQGECTTAKRWCIE